MTGYADLFASWDSPVQRAVRAAAYGEDIGQHSWVDADDLRADLARMAMAPNATLLDCGAGPCGPLTFAMRESGCGGMAVDASPAALAAGARRAVACGVGERFLACAADLSCALPIATGACDAAMALDVALHLPDRAAFFREVARALRPGGAFLLTDAGVQHAPLDATEAAARASFGATYFVAPGATERHLAAAGFRVAFCEDRTDRVERIASKRHAARETHRAALVASEGGAAFARHQRYLEATAVLATRGALRRSAWLAVLDAGTPNK